MGKRRNWPKENNDVILRCPCEFTGLSIGDATASLGAKVGREFLADDRARNLLCGRRITGVILVGESDPQQGMLIKDAAYRIEAVFDVKRLGMSPKDWTFRLTYSLGEIDVEARRISPSKKGR